MKRDIQDRKDIELLVDEFYGHVRKDSLLAPIFEAHIKDWTPHLETMYKFWSAALLDIREYSGNPLAKHLHMPLGQQHFEQWINLFYRTIDSHFEGPVADDAKHKSMMIAHTFYRRISADRSTTLHELPKI